MRELVGHFEQDESLQESQDAVPVDDELTHVDSDPMDSSLENEVCSVSSGSLF